MPPELPVQQQQQTPPAPQPGSTPNRQPNGGNPAPETPAAKPQSSSASGSLFAEAGLDEPGKPGSTVWPEAWRLQMAGGDEKLAKRLERYGTPDAVGKALLGIQQRISTGEFRANTPKPTGDGVKPEEIAAWKQERGLPTEAKEYPFPLAKGMKMEDLGEDGVKTADRFKGAFFDADMTPAQVERVMGEYNAIQEELATQQATADAKAKDALEDDLRANWGGEYRKNIATTHKFIENTFGEDLATALMTARDIEGNRIINMPGMVAKLHDLARQLGIDDVEGGEPTLGGGKSVDQRIEEINQIYVTNPQEYWSKNLADEKQKLLERKERAGAR